MIDEKWNGRNYWLKARLLANSEDVAASIAEVRKDSKLAEALQEVARRKAALANVKSDLTQDDEKRRAYQVAVHQLQASESFEEGLSLTILGDYEGTAKAYFNRGIVFIYPGDYGQAIRDLNQAERRPTKLVKSVDQEKPINRVNETP